MKNSMTTVLKAISLLLLDTITGFLIFVIWEMNGFPIFPTAISFILVPLLLVNFVILCYSNLEESISSPSAISTLITTIVFYLFTMVYTGNTYKNVEQKWYLLTMFIALFVYIAIIACVYFAGKNRAGLDLSQQSEKDSVLDIKMVMMQTTNLLNNANFTAENKTIVKNAVDRTFERINSGTPFGRSQRPAIVNLEVSIFNKLTEANQVLAGNAEEINYQELADSFGNVCDMVKDKEKMMVM